MIMMDNQTNLLSEIEAFLAETGMGPSYFGKQAIGNSEVVTRLRDGRRVWPETSNRLRAFMLAHRRIAQTKGANGERRVS